MEIVYMVPTYYKQEVSSREHDEKLNLLRSLKEMGKIEIIEKAYSYSGWTLTGYVDNTMLEFGYVYSGTWEEVGKPKKANTEDILCNHDIE